MKLLTLNLHCFAEKKIKDKQRQIADLIIDEGIDIVFFQEVAQGKDLDILLDDIKQDNYAYTIKKLLKEKGLDYYIHYKTGNLTFGKYDEGLAILSKTELFDFTHFFISKKVEYNDWNTRVIVSAKTKIYGKVITLTSAHLGWSNGFEVFEDQFDILLDNLNTEDSNIIAGDFNVKAGSKEYNYVVNKGYLDIYFNNELEHYLTPTHINDMDVQVGSSRIDYIMSNKQFKLINRKVIFKENRVSDHYGVLVELDI